MSADRVAQFEADIAASPAALSALLDGWAAPDLGGLRRIVIDTVARRGGVVTTVAPMGGPVLARAIVDSVVAERVAVALWRRASACDKVP